MKISLVKNSNFKNSRFLFYYITPTPKLSLREKKNRMILILKIREEISKFQASGWISCSCYKSIGKYSLTAQSTSSFITFWIGLFISKNHLTTFWNCIWRFENFAWGMICWYVYVDDILILMRSISRVDGYQFRSFFV